MSQGTHCISLTECSYRYYSTKSQDAHCISLTECSYRCYSNMSQGTHCISLTECSYRCYSSMSQGTHCISLTECSYRFYSSMSQGTHCISLTECSYRCYSSMSQGTHCISLTECSYRCYSSMSQGKHTQYCPCTPTQIKRFIIYNQATERDPMNSGDGGARFSPLLAFCRIPFSPLSTSPKRLSLSTTWMLLPKFAWTKWLDNWSRGLGMYGCMLVGEITVVGSMEGWIYKAPLRALSVVKNVDVIGLLFKINQSRN
jgi:hypothetical protein